MTPPARTLFVGLGSTAVMYYRCMLPALALGADWMGLSGTPPAMVLKTGLVGGRTRMAAMEDYDVVIMQQPRGRKWLGIIRRLQARGIVVLVEVDDYLHGIRKLKDHDYSRFFRKEDLAELELNMRAADGLIVSTDYIARRYRKFNARVWVCPNGIDAARYALTRPPRETVTIGWAGATGHTRAVGPWLDQIAKVMATNPHVLFASIGQNYADAMAPHFPPERFISVPFCMVEQYPAAMTLFDIAIGPGSDTAFFRGKSDLRWLEASALGVPLVGDPVLFPSMVDGQTGFAASDPRRAGELLAELVDDPTLRLKVGARARDVVRSSRDISIAAAAWRSVIEEVTGS